MKLAYVVRSHQGWASPRFGGVKAEEDGLLWLVRQSVRRSTVNWTSFVTDCTMVSHGLELNPFDGDPVPVITKSVFLR